MSGDLLYARFDRGRYCGTCRAIEIPAAVPKVIYLYPGKDSTESACSFSFASLPVATPCISLSHISGLRGEQVYVLTSVIPVKQKTPAIHVYTYSPATKE